MRRMRGHGRGSGAPFKRARLGAAGLAAYPAQRITRMLFLADTTLPAWVVTLVPWLLGLCVVAAACAALGVWLVHARLRELQALGERLAVLDEIKSALVRVAKEREDLDLRRIEHVLIEMRDGQRRLEDTLLRAAQGGAKPTEGATPRAGDAAGLGERIVQRLLAHGYERVQIIPTLDELTKLFEADGANEVLVEARRNGVLCKGRVLVRDGVVVDVELQPAYSMFP